jgi:hypothetical protein
MTRYLPTRPRGRHRAGTPRPWPVGWRSGVDPWAGQPLFCTQLERQQAAARNVTCGRAL